MPNLLNIVVYFAAIFLVDVVVSSRLTVQIDNAGSVTYEQPKNLQGTASWVTVEEDTTFKKITDAGAVASIEKWLKTRMEGVKFDHLTKNDVKKYEKSAELDVWIPGFSDTWDQHDIIAEPHSNLGATGRLKNALESQTVANKLKEQVFGGTWPEKVHFGVTRRPYAFGNGDDVKGGMNFGIILKNIEEKSESTAKSESGIHTGSTAHTDKAAQPPHGRAAQNATGQRNSGNGTQTAGH